ncbi:response regulator [Paenibacillus sp. CC-CFT747]|nr:response regulator [Paenibacillus sp. CC-CFT747]
MKILIVDDELHVRDAIRLLVDWDRYGISDILEASDGQAAVELLQEHSPEIVFTDMMMPGMNGVGLLEWIQENAPRTKAVVISGHDDFDFVRNTVKFGGLDYILKPVDPDQLQEAVKRAVEARTKEDEERKRNQQRGMEINQIKPVYWDKMFSQCIDDPSYYHSIRDSVHQEFGLRPGDETCRVAILSLDRMDRKVRDKFASAMDLLFFSLLNICNEYLRRTNRGFAFRHWNSTREIILILWRDLTTASALLGHINEGIFRTLGGRFEFGLGSEKPLPPGLQHSYREAAEALDRRNLLQLSSWIHEKRPGAEAFRGPVLHFTDYEEPVRFAVRSGSDEQIREALGQWFREVRKLSYISPEQSELWRDEYHVLKAIWIKELLPGMTDSELGPLQEETRPYIVPLNDSGTLSMEKWEQELTASLLELARLVRQSQGREGHHVIYDIEKYLRTHYHQDIALQDMADKYHLSREYISRKFKQEFNENLSDYVGRIRIEKAKQLLVDPGLRISQVADMVGYSDEKYFSKVFKKLTGSSPNDYRKQLARKA